MKILIVFVVLLFGTRGLSQVTFLKPSGIYELAQPNTLITPVEFETLFGYDTIAKKMDPDDCRYVITKDGNILFELEPIVLANGLRILIIYGDKTTETIFVADKYFVKSVDSYKYQTNIAHVVVSLVPHAIFLINIPVKYKQKTAILHLLHTFK